MCSIFYSTVQLYCLHSNAAVLSKKKEYIHIWLLVSIYCFFNVSLQSSLQETFKEITDLQWLQKYSGPLLQ